MTSDVRMHSTSEVYTSHKSKKSLMLTMAASFWTPALSITSTLFSQTTLSTGMMRSLQMGSKCAKSLAFGLLLLVPMHSVSCAAWSLEGPRHRALSSLNDANANNIAYNKNGEAVSRRDCVLQVASAASMSALLLSPTSPTWATAENDNQQLQQPQQGGGLLSTNTVADILHVVPTFTIVDAKGVPYMVVGEDAKVTGYFFATYEEANRILNLARTSADKAIRQAKQQRDKEPVVDDENPWNKARISTVPLDVAVTIATKSLYTKNYFQIAPAQDDVEDALAITGKTYLPEGKVPLFYMKDFTLPNNNNNNNNNNNSKKGDSTITTTSSSQPSSPLYFRKSELLDAYKRQNPGQTEIPEVLVTELFAVLLEMVKPGGTDEDLKTLVLVPPKGSEQRAKQCIKAGGKEPPFTLGKRNLVL